MADRKTTRREAAKAAPRRPAPAPFTLTTRWAAAILGLLTIVLFHELVLGGKTFVSPDTFAPAGFVRMGEQSLWRDHVYPLWNPFVFLGMPSFASGAYNPLIYPPDWPLALVQKVLPFLPDMTWMLLYYFLGGLFLFLLAREWGARPEGALLGAVAFVFAPNLVAVGSHGHGSQLVDSAYLPLMLWLASRWLRRGGLHHLAWLALAGGFQLLRGHVQICFYTWLAVALYAVVAWVAALRRREAAGPATARAAALAVAAGLAFGLAGFYNLPLNDYSKHSIRSAGEGGGTGIQYATSWSLAPIELLTVVVPGWAGFGNPTYWGGMPFTDYPNAFLGIVTVVLALPALLSGGVPRVFALVLGVLALLISFGRYFPLYGFLYDHLPLFNKFRIPVMVVILFQLAVALAAAWGWSAILPGSERAPRARRVGRLLLVTAGALALAFVVGVMAQDAWRDRYIRMAVSFRESVMPLSANPYDAQAATVAWQGFVSDLRLACLLGLLAVGVAWLARRGKLPALAATGAALVLLLLNLWPVSARVMKPVIGQRVQRSLEFGRDDVVEFLEKAGPPGTFRVLMPEDPMTNRFAGFGISALNGYHAAKPRLYEDFRSRRLEENLAWLRLLNVRYLVVSQPFERVPEFLREAFRGSMVVYENRMALPRATVVGRYEVVTPAIAILDTIGRRSFSAERMMELGEVTCLERDPRLALGPVAGARAGVASYRLNDVTVDVETPGPGLLRLADLWYPDWKATVDGRPVEILKADYLLRAVPVPAGRHRVEFRFQPAAVRAGMLASLASLAAILALFGWSFVRRRRRPAEAPAGGKA